MATNGASNMTNNATTLLSATTSAVPVPQSDEASQFETSQATFIIVIVMLSLFTVFGVIGNALAFYIYSKKRDKTTSNVFILALAATDFVVCLVVVPYTIIAESVEYEFVYDIPCKLYMFCITSNVPLSAFIMTAIAFDRYCCICHPFLHVLTVQRAKFACVALTILSALLGVMTALNFGVYELQRLEIPLEAPGNGTSFNETLNETDVSRQTYYDVMNVSLSYDVTNSTGYPQYNETRDTEIHKVYLGVCVPGAIILSMDFTRIYQKLYAGTFLLCLIAVAILYTLIYRSILVRRRWRSKRKRMSCYTSVNGVETAAEETQLTAINGNNIITDEKKSKRPFQSRQAAIREKTLYANIKTAAMLFVVTVVFVISFLPSWLMGLQIIQFSVIVYNLYFLNNVANPIIYAFMNRAFRDDLRALIRGCK
ncbi:orexin receptor type 2-like [Haliotis asinina]|uniref:orexin receptor type 2-like n=1 Tax=Haliotis asinina TaxID=109174 RepID=UPI0035327CC7